jgi:hypothetical protein
MAYPLRGSDRSRRCCADVGSDDRIRNPKLSNVATARKQRGSFDRSFGARNRDPVDRRLMPILVRLIADGHILAIPFHASRKSDGLIQGDGLERSAAVAKLQQLKGALSTEQPRRADASGSVSVALASYRRARIRRLSRRRYRRQIHKRLCALASGAIHDGLRSGCTNEGGTDKAPSGVAYGVPVGHCDSPQPASSARAEIVPRAWRLQPKLLTAG